MVVGVETGRYESITTKEDSVGTMDGEITVVTEATIMAGIAAGVTLTIPGMVQERGTSTSRIGRRNRGETPTNSSSCSIVTVVGDGRGTPEEEDSGMVEEGDRKMTESKVPSGMVVKSRNR